jgi:endonuclease/exonuclease/phosphatase family metal-dependent hydrolase
MAQLRSVPDERTHEVEAPTSRNGDAVGLVAVTVAVTVGCQCLRVLFPLAYSYREASGVTRTVAILVCVFVTPAIAPALARLTRASTVFVTAAIVLAVLRITVQAVESVPIALAAVAAAAGLFTIASGVVGFRHRGAALVVAIVAGLAIDTAVRGAWSTWDIAWQHGALPSLVTVALVALLLAAAVIGRAGARDEAGSLAVVGLALGAYLAVQVWFLQSIAFSTSSAGLSLATAVVVVLAGDAVALVLVARWSRPRGGPATALAGAVIAGSVGWWLPRASGATAVLLVVGGQAVGTVLLAWALSSPRRAAHRPTLADTLGLAAGFLIFGSAVLLYQLHYDLPLPVSNRWLFTAAGAVLAISSLWERMPSPPERHRVPGALAVAAAVAVAGGALFVALTTGEPDLSPAAAHDSLRVVTYNPHETVTRDGQLDPEAFARAVERLRPDLLVVEEAGRGWQLSAGTDLAEWTKRRLGLPYVWGPAADHQFGNLVFSRVPVLGARVIQLPRAKGTMDRSAVIARVGPVAGEPITVVGVHLQNGGGVAGRESRLAEIQTLARELGPAPRRTVIAGDLNSDPGSPELHALLDLGFRTRQPTEHCTLTTSNQHCSDWILVTPDLEQRHLQVLRFDEFDHRPVVSDVSARRAS